MKLKMNRRKFLQLAGAAAAAGALAGCGKKSAKQQAADEAGGALEKLMEEKLQADQSAAGAESTDSAASSEEAAASERAAEEPASGTQAEEKVPEEEIGAEEIYEADLEGDTSTVYVTAKKGDDRIEITVEWDDPEEVPYFAEELALTYGASSAGVHEHSWNSMVDFYVLLSDHITRGEVLGGGADGVKLWVPAGTTATCSAHFWSEDGASFDLDSRSFNLTSDNLFDYTGSGAVTIVQE